MDMRYFSLDMRRSHTRILGRDKVGIRALGFLVVHGARVLW